MQQLAKAIARDGEGATCLMEVQVKGAVDEAAALRVARTICGSSLVKTAVHGRDPNWGRIVAAAVGLMSRSIPKLWSFGLAPIS
jgi:glutamate N-acetyltransferase/amino-acid N-acetyltransferase